MSQITQIKVSNIIPDPNQPRKYFNAEKIKTLKNSIKSYGVINPIIVQQQSTGKYLVIDGERRYRSAIELGLESLPAIVEKPQQETQRLVRQFNIQEQHEEWTPIEKAMAITNLAKTMNLSLPAVCKLLNVSEQAQRRYAAFAELLDKDAWIRQEIPLDFAQSMHSLQSQSRTLTTKVLEKDFTASDAKKMETKVIRLIKKGVINRRGELTRLTDAFKKDPTAISKFINDADSTPMSLFTETRARGAYYLRNCVSSSLWVNNHGKKYLEAKDIKPDTQQIEVMKRAIKTLTLVIAQG